MWRKWRKFSVKSSRRLWQPHTFPKKRSAEKVAFLWPVFNLEKSCASVPQFQIQLAIGHSPPRFKNANPATTLKRGHKVENLMEFLLKFPSSRRQNKARSHKHSRRMLRCQNWRVSFQDGCRCVRVPFDLELHKGHQILVQSPRKHFELIAGELIE